MDYARIYRDFIRDRMGKPEPEGYSEVHHILPRCLAGTDSHQNLIRLTPEDHFFAHLLLAKVHGGKLWRAVALMSGLQRVNGALWLGRRRWSYAYSRAQYVAYMSAPDSDRRDQTVYHWRHIDGREVWATRFEMQRDYGIGVGSVAQVLSRRSMSCLGWYLPSVIPDGSLVGKGLAGGRNPAADPNVYHFRHKDGREEVCTRTELAEKYGLKPNDIGSLFFGAAKSSRGWFLPENNPDGKVHAENTAGEGNWSFDHKEYRFVNDDGREITSTKFAMKRRFGGTGWYKITSAPGRTYKGWRLADSIRAERGVLQRDPNRYELKHTDGRSICGTRLELASALEIEGSRLSSCISSMLNGSLRSYRGWYFPSMWSPSDLGLAAMSGDRHYAARKEVYRFAHADGRSYIGTRASFARTLGFEHAATSVGQLVAGKRATLKGWRLEGEVNGT